ncbi:MAG: DUF262 domain-containing protein [bacterium]
MNEYEREQIDIDNEIEEVSTEIKKESFLKTSSYNSDLSVDMLINYADKKKFIFDPDFQRREVWDISRKSQFIESLILHLPIPSILLADDNKRNKFIVIDGKQRISTIIEFISIENGKSFKLKGLKVLKELNGLNYLDLKTKHDLTEYVSQLETYPLRATIVKNYDEKLLYFIFARLNSGSVPLSTQELRHTLFPGSFSSFINENSLNSKGIRKILNIKEGSTSKRMKDAELLCRFYAFKYYKDLYSTTIGDILDLTYKNLNREWKNMKEQIERDIINFENSIEFIYEHFGEHAFKIYNPSKDEFLVFNRLLFDVLSVLFACEKNRKLVNDKNDILLIDFLKDLFTSNEKFIDAFKPTVSSKEKTLNRRNIFETEFLNTYDK